ncbi:MAG: hypothetical protein R3C41_22170 [Calditrichia bacterium]
MALVEPLTAKKDRDDARQMLWFLLLWFQDILHINKGVKTTGKSAMWTKPTRYENSSLSHQPQKSTASFAKLRQLFANG